MKIVFISDTHNMHDDLFVPEGDMVIHSGDVCNRGTRNEAVDFLIWFSKLPHRYKIFIAGNHDFIFENSPKLMEEGIPKNIFYLNDSMVEVEGIKIWGSPISPWFHNWAFNRQRGAEIKQHWDLIPNDTDILITHGPPEGIMDKTIYTQENVGCKDLLNKVNQISPKIHCFGHIHEGYGIKEIGETTFINASSVDINYKMNNKPIIKSI